MADSGEQRSNIAKTVLFLCLIMALLVFGVVYRIMQPAVLSQAQLRATGTFIFDQPRVIKAFSLIDHKGQVFDKERLKGKWTLMFFGFTACPDICPTTMVELKKLADSLAGTDAGKDLQVVFVSVDPARDTVPVLAEYVPYFHPDFIGVTGEFLDLHRFATNVNVAFNKVPGGGENYTMDHSANIIIVNPMGDYHGFFKPPFDPERMKINYRSIRHSF